MSVTTLKLGTFGLQILRRFDKLIRLIVFKFVHTIPVNCIFTQTIVKKCLKTVKTFIFMNRYHLIPFIFIHLCSQKQHTVYSYPETV